MNSSRRTFIKNSSIILAGSALVSNPYASAINNKQEKLAIQLCSVDKEMHDDAERTLTTLKKIGYKYVEHAGYVSRKFYGFSPLEFRSLVNDCGLTLLSGHTVLRLQHWDEANQTFTPEWHNIIEDAAMAGQQFLITPWLDRSLWNDEKKLKGFMEVFNRSGELCKKAGLQFGYHNHDFEFTHTFGSQRLYDIILQHTDPKLVAQQLDIGNISHHEFPVTDILAQYPGRFHLMHVKDKTQTNEKYRGYKSVTVGDGLLDMNSIIAKARLTGGTYNFIIELENDSTLEPFNCAKKNYEVFTI